MSPSRERMRELGRKGGKAKARRNLTLRRVEEELGALESPADAARWLRLLGTWAAAGMLSGAVAGACVRAVEVWIRGIREAETEAELRELQEAVRELKRGKLRALD